MDEDLGHVAKVDRCAVEPDVDCDHVAGWSVVDRVFADDRGEERREASADDLRRRPPDRRGARPVGLVAGEVPPQVRGLGAGQEQPPEDRFERVRHERGSGEHGDRLGRDDGLLCGDAAELHRKAGDVARGEHAVRAEDAAVVVDGDEPLRRLGDAVDSPAALLKRRPDIRAAERELAAATARIGVAKADLFPRLTLSGFIGFVAGDADSLGESESRAWSVAPVLSWAGFERGTWARVAVAEARADAALAGYELTVLRALEETENALVTYGTHRARLQSVVEQATASRTAAELARVQYREGALDFLRLLDAERTLLQAEDAVAAAESDLNASVVLIYKALGGGWEAAPIPTI